MAHIQSCPPTPGPYTSPAAAVPRYISTPPTFVTEPPPLPTLQRFRLPHVEQIPLMDLLDGSAHPPPSRIPTSVGDANLRSSELCPAMMPSRAATSSRRRCMFAPATAARPLLATFLLTQAAALSVAAV
ncbi:hypothetical protein BDN70DRAFT_936478 [Pholiota conissans]|uniref:Uncharacterized protein n=1 Tax=Pholiota conissans TaxID=109636 RepID=A0A9P5YVK6_9AGAR|nr:hypothetical protein BDN70DRAFT_936478 [Pholiota conissans]